MTIVMFGGKRGRLASRRTPSQPWSTGVAASCGVLCCKWVFQMDNDPKHTSKVVAKWLKGNKVKVFELPSESLDLNPLENLWAELKKACVSKEVYKPDSVTPALSGGMDQIHPTYSGELVEGYPKRLTQVKQFKGNATKYSLSVCKLLTHWESDERNKSWNKSFSLLLFWHFTFLK